MPGPCQETSFEDPVPRFANRLLTDILVTELSERFLQRLGEEGGNNFCREQAAGTSLSGF